MWFIVSAPLHNLAATVLCCQFANHDKSYQQKDKGEAQPKREREKDPYYSAQGIRYSNLHANGNTVIVGGRRGIEEDGIALAVIILLSYSHGRGGG